MSVTRPIQGIISQPCGTTQTYFQSDEDVNIVIDEIINDSDSSCDIKALLVNKFGCVAASVDVAPGQGKSLAAKKAAFFVVKAGGSNSKDSSITLDKTQGESTVSDKRDEKCNSVNKSAKGSYSGNIITI
jgi:hypothetical protein